MLLGIATLALALAMMPTAPSSAQPPPAPVVSVAELPALPPGAVATSALPPSTALSVDVVLRSQDPEGLTALASSVSAPGSPEFRRYLQAGQFAARFGATGSTVQLVRRQLTAEGLVVAGLSEDRLVMSVHGSAAALGAALSTGFEVYRLPDGRRAYANTSPATLPAGIGRSVQTVVGLDSVDLPAPASASAKTTSQLSRDHPSTPTDGTVGPQPCTSATKAAEKAAKLGLTVYPMNTVADSYGFQDLYGAGDLGANQSVAVVELGRYSATDVASYQSCFGTSAAVDPIDVDGGPSSTSGVGEANGDIETIASLAPDANVLVYQAPNVTYKNLFDAMNTAISQDVAKAISISWGECEPIRSGVQQSLETALEEAALQGQTVLAASGDDGSEDCYSFTGSKGLAVESPADLPGMTAVGGTQWSAPGTPPAEAAWNSRPNWGATGGGRSSYWLMPSYQADAPPSLGVINSYSAGKPCGALSGTFCREMPDVSALAGEYPYLFVQHGGWAAWGGTSFATPLWAALVALTDGLPACQGTSVGFLNPSLYELAVSTPSAFQDITSGNNDWTGTHGGRFPATPGYDMATGLGTPNAGVLPDSLCSEGTSTAG